MTRISLVFTFLLFGWLTVAASAMTPDAAIDLANRLGNNNDIDGAVRVLRDTLKRYPTEETLYLAQGDWLEERALDTMGVTATDTTERRTILSKELMKYPDLAKEIFEQYGVGLMYVPGSTAIQERTRALVTYHYPQVLGEYGALALPGDPVPFVYELTDPRLSSEKRGERHGLITTTAQPVTRLYSRDPKYGYGLSQGKDSRYQNWVFHQMLVAYDQDDKEQNWRLKCRVMWQTVPGEEAERLVLARNVARTLLQLNEMAEAYMGFSPRYTTDGVVNVWLAEGGEAGGEAYNENIYLEQVGIDRPAAEWVREVAHEFGHQVFPAVGGYESPEWGANGRMGERLFLRWLAQNPGMDPDHLWLAQTDFSTTRRTRIDPLQRQFAEDGPEHPRTNGCDEAGMNGFVGMALYLDHVRGSFALAGMLKAMSTPAFAGPKGFLQSVEDQEMYLQSTDRPATLLNVRDMPLGMPLWVFLRDGVWRGSVSTLKEADMPLLNSLAVQVDGTPVKTDGRGGFTTAPLARGWHRVTLTYTGTPPALGDLRLVRQ